MSETIFRILAGMILVSGVGISFYHRRKAEKNNGEKIPRSVDGPVFMVVIIIGGLVLWLSPLTYLIHPAWMTWSKVNLPDWVRWIGAGTGALCVALIYWIFHSIGSSITPTSATRKGHKLVTNGIYRYVRHPLYTVGSSLFVSLGMIADNWFIAGLGMLAFILMALRTPKEEANLIETFGDEYRNYVKTTGRFLPRLTR